MAVSGRLWDRDAGARMKTPSFMSHQHFLLSFVWAVVLKETHGLEMWMICYVKVAGGTKLSDGPTRDDEQSLVWSKVTYSGACCCLSQFR